MSDIEIVRLTPEDWEAFRDIRLRSLADAPSAFGTTLADASRLDITGWRLRLADCARWVARDGGRDVGTAGAFREGDAIVLVGMWVDPSARRRGIGASLVDTVIRHARDEATCRRVVLRVTEGNAEAERLYARCGFTPTGVREPMSDAPDARFECELALWLT
jgi:RimJ/RimL family protein N-acetyltransferase